MCVLIYTENAYHANTRQHRQEEGIFPLGIDSRGSPTDSRGDLHRFKRWPLPRVWCGTLLHVTLCSVWGIDSRGGPQRFKRWLPSHVWCSSLLRVAPSSIQDPPDASTIVEYIIVIPHQTCPARRRSDCAINKSNGVGGHEYRGYRSSGVQDFRSTGVPDVW